MAQTPQQQNSRTSAKNWASKSTMHQSHTRNPTARWKKANGLVRRGLKKRLLAPLEQAAGNWVEELPVVLWSQRTTPNTITQYTPFFMVCGSEAVLPHDLKFGAPQVSGYEEEKVEEALQDDKDRVDEA